MAFRALIHNFFLFQFILFYRLLNGAGALRKKVVTTVAVAKSLLMTVMGERNVPETAPKQNHFFCPAAIIGGIDRKTR